MGPAVHIPFKTNLVIEVRIWYSYTTICAEVFSRLRITVCDETKGSPCCPMPRKSYGRSPTLTLSHTMYTLVQVNVPCHTPKLSICEDLQDPLLMTWRKIRQNTFRGLVESMPRWVELF